MENHPSLIFFINFISFIVKFSLHISPQWKYPIWGMSYTYEYTYEVCYVVFVHRLRAGKFWVGKVKLVGQVSLPLY